MFGENEEEFDKSNPQHLFNLISASILIGNLIENGFIEGPFTVNMDHCYSSLKIIHATEDVVIPEKLAVVNLALALMRTSGLREDDVEDITMLLSNTEVDYSFAPEA